MQKIFIISRFAKMGGTRTFYNNFINYCIQNDYTPYIIFTSNVLSSDQIKLLKENNIHYKILDDNPRLSIMRRYFQNMYILCLAIKYILKYRIKKVVFTQWDLISDLPTLLLLLLKIDIRFFVHSDATGVNRYKMLFKIVKYAFSKLIKKNLILTVSNYNKNKILSTWSADANNVKVLYNFSNLTNVKSNEHKMKNEQIVLTLGHVNDYKNPELWLEVAKKVTKQRENTKFIWAGEGNLFNEYKYKTKNDSQIEFLGFIEDVSNLYKHADLYLQLSKRETQGISVLDAMKNAIPCIVSNRGGLPESIIDNHSGYIVDLDDIDLIVNKVCGLLSNEEKRKNFGENSYQVYKNKFSQESWYKRLDELL